jgi:hypothetical protein
MATLKLFLLLRYWVKTSWFMSSFFIVMLEQLFHIIDLLFLWWFNFRWFCQLMGKLSVSNLQAG